LYLKYLTLLGHHDFLWIMPIAGKFFWAHLHHTWAWRSFWGDQLHIPTRYKFSTQSLRIYTCNGKVLAWGQSPLSTSPRVHVWYAHMDTEINWVLHTCRAHKNLFSYTRITDKSTNFPAVWIGMDIFEYQLKYCAQARAKEEVIFSN